MNLYGHHLLSLKNRSTFFFRRNNHPSSVCPMSRRSFVFWKWSTQQTIFWEILRNLFLRFGHSRNAGRDCLERGSSRIPIHTTITFYYRQPPKKVAACFCLAYFFHQWTYLQAPWGISDFLRNSLRTSSCSICVPPYISSINHDFPHHPQLFRLHFQA